MAGRLCHTDKWGHLNPTPSVSDIGIEIAGSTPEALQAEVANEIARWTKVIKDANIKQG